MFSLRSQHGLNLVLALTQHTCPCSCQILSRNLILPLCSRLPRLGFPSQHLPLSWLMEQVNCSCFPMKVRPFGYSQWSWQECRKPEAWGLRWSGSLCSMLAALLISSEISFPWRKMTAVVGNGCSIQQGPGMCFPHVCLLQDLASCNREEFVPVAHGLCQEGFWVSHGFVLPDTRLQKEPRLLSSTSHILWFGCSGQPIAVLVAEHPVRFLSERECCLLFARFH